MKNKIKRYSIRVNGLEIMEFDSIQKTVKIYNRLTMALPNNKDIICVYDRGTMTYLY